MKWFVSPLLFLYLELLFQSENAVTMKRTAIVIPVILIIVALSCTNQSKKVEIIDSEKYNTYLEKGDEISNRAQAVLLGNVSAAMKKDGPEYAVEFCNLKASSIIDSLNRANKSVISRVSSKNRNPDNDLKTKKEKRLWKSMAELVENGNAHDTLLMMNNQLVYYKPIKTALPACLNCHGDPGADIQPTVVQKINEYYPNDKATGYTLNEFRGMWKIIFLNDE